MQNFYNQNLSQISFLLFSTILVFLLIIQFPEVNNLFNHDVGSVAAYDYWTKNRFSYGKEIIQNVGPLGFINYPSLYTGILDIEKFYINIIITFTTSLLISLIISGQEVRLKCFSFLIIFLFLDHDTHFYILFSLISFNLFFKKRNLGNFFLLFLLSVLALSKGMFIYLTFFLLIIFSLNSLIFKKSFIGFFYFCVLLLCIVFNWILIGQEISILPIFIFKLFAFVGGYNEAMSIHESNGMLIVGLIIGALFVLSMLSGILTIRNDSLAFKKTANIYMFSLVQFSILFVTWKHGFVRADEHVIIFFQFVVVNFFLIYSNVLKMDNNKGHNVYNFFYNTISILLILFSVIGVSVAHRILPNDIIADKVIDFKKNIAFIFNVQKKFNDLELKLQKEIKKIELPEITAIVKKEYIGYFGIYPGVMIFNKFNYKSSPATISFAGWNKIISEFDKKFYESDITAPKYILFDLKTIDGRLVASDSSLSQIELLHRYRLVHIEKGYLLLKRINGQANLKIKNLESFKIDMNDQVNLDIYEENIWLSVKFKKDFIFKVLSFLYKAPDFYIDVEFTNGLQKNYRIIPNMSEIGFLINPFIDNNYTNLLSRLKPSNLKKPKIKSISFKCKNIKYFCSKEAIITIKKLVNLRNEGDIIIQETDILDNRKLYPIVTRIRGDSYKIDHTFNSIRVNNAPSIYNKPEGFDKLTSNYEIFKIRKNLNSKEQTFNKLLNFVKRTINFNRKNNNIKDKEITLKVLFIDKIRKKETDTVFEKSWGIKEISNANNINSMSFDLPKKEGFLIFNFTSLNSNFDEIDLSLIEPHLISNNYVK